MKRNIPFGCAVSGKLLALGLADPALTLRRRPQAQTHARLQAA